MTGILGAIQLRRYRITVMQKGHFVKGIGTDADLVSTVINIYPAIAGIIGVNAIGEIPRTQPFQVILFLRKAPVQTGETDLNLNGP
jgi:hypothetical protein